MSFRRPFAKCTNSNHNLLSDCSQFKKDCPHCLNSLFLWRKPLADLHALNACICWLQIRKGMFQLQLLLDHLEKRIQAAFRHQIMCKIGSRRQREVKREVMLIFMLAFIRLSVMLFTLNLHLLAYSLILFVYYLRVKMQMLNQLVFSGWDEWADQRSAQLVGSEVLHGPSTLYKEGPTDDDHRIQVCLSCLGLN